MDVKKQQRSIEETNYVFDVLSSAETHDELEEAACVNGITSHSLDKSVCFFLNKKIILFIQK